MPTRHVEKRQLLSSLVRSDGVLVLEPVRVRVNPIRVGAKPGRFNTPSQHGIGVEI